MNCHECQEQLQQRLDGAPTGDAPALEQHLSECPTCREQHAAAVRLLTGLSHLPKLTLPADFAHTITAGVLHDRRRRQGKMQRRVFVTAALAASVLLMLAAAFYWMPRDGSPQKQELVKGQPKKIVAPPIATPIEPRPALTTLTERVADATRDHAKVVLAAANLDGVEKLPVNDLPGIDPGLREASQEVSDGLRTVTQNTRKAFAFFARELPMPEMTELKN